MRTYEKIDTIYARDVEGTKKLMPGMFRNPTVEFLATNKWIWTEKVDGTNIRVSWDGHSVSFGGRTDNASIPASLMNKLNELFGGEINAQLFEQAFGERKVILFGEGYGCKIQKVGSAYLPKDVGFILFDVLVGENYQEREWVEKTAEMFNIPVVPIVGEGNLSEAVDYVKHHPTSVVADHRCEMEGIVCRPAVELKDRRGERIIVKIKWQDFKDLVDS
jgi:hypothetical protein